MNRPGGARRDNPIRFALLAAVSTIHDTPALREMVESYLSALRGVGETPAPGGGRPDAPLVVFVATGGTEREVLGSAQSDGGEPALLVAHPGQNSLPAAMEVLARLQQLGIRGEIRYLRDPDDADGLGALVEAVRDRSVRRALAESRIGLVGRPSDWLVASAPAPETVRGVWGPEVVPVPMESILAEPGGEIDARAGEIAREFRERARTVVEPAESDLLASGRIYAVLRGLVEAGRFDAVAVRCFDLVARRHATGCLALARLNDEGIVAGCEGDLVTTVAMLWVRLMTGEASWMANPSRVDPERGVLSLAHCTVPFSLGGAFDLRSHFESGLGVGIRGTMPAGPVTLVRIGGARMEQLRALDGELLSNTDHADLCRTQVEVRVGREALHDLLARPLGNHLVVVAGHHAGALRRWHGTIIG